MGALVLGLKKLALYLLTEKAVARITFAGLEHLAKRTDNDIDDKLVNAAKSLYYRGSNRP
jgi:hypothetical protein